jgi:hypothetical protein
VVVGLRTTIDSRTSSGGGARFSAESGYRHPEETLAPGRIRGASLAHLGSLIFYSGTKKERNFSATASGFSVTSLQYVIA